MALSSKLSLSFVLLTAFLTISDATRLTTKSEIGSKNILVLLPIAAQSHHNIFSALTNELLERGHYLTIASARPQKTKHPRLRDILLRDAFEKFFHQMVSNMLKAPKSVIEMTLLMLTTGPLINEVVFESPKVLALKEEKFDLVITETFFFQEPMLAFAHHFGCPSMSINPFGYSHHLNELTGGATNPAYVPNPFGTAIKPKTFFDRLKNTLIVIPWMLTYYLFYIPQAEAQMRTAFPDAPPLHDLIKNISLTLINNNNALMHAVPLAPSVIEVAGIHIKPGKPLPADLKKWIEDSKDGFVYFSLGSNLQANWLPEEKQKAIFQSLEKLKQRVLVKWNGGVPADPPKNCRFEEWIPQQEVLAHPNLKVFITHGGLLSTQESVYFGAAMIGIPIFGDQYMNMATAVEQGFAVQVSIYDLTTEKLDFALNEVVNNPKYRERSKELSAYFRLDPVPSLDKAVYYTEQLIKLGSFKHLQPSSVNLHWYQYMLLDVIAVIAIGLYVTWRVLRLICSALLGCCRKSSKPKND